MSFAEPSKRQKTSSSSEGGVDSLPHPSQRRSWAWPYFSAPAGPTPKGAQIKLKCTFKCKNGKECGEQIVWTGSAGNLANHLKFVHDLRDPSKPSPVAALSTDISSFAIPKPNLQDRVVKLVCFDLKPIKIMEGTRSPPALPPPFSVSSPSLIQVRL
jgi:hypothetical protein